MKQLYRLSRIERTFWVNEKVHDSRNHVLVVFQTSVLVNLHLLEESLKHLIDQTPQFHSVIVEKNGEPYWHTADGFNYPITIAAYKDEETEYEIEKSKKESFCFDHTSDFLCRFRLLEGKNHHLLLFLFHHILMEDSSMQLFCARLSYIYNELSAGHEPKERESHYYDFAGWEDELYRQKDVEAGIAYWNRYVEGVQNEAVRLQSYFPSCYAAGRITSHRFVFGELQRQLTELCHKKKVGPFRLLSAAWAVTVLKVFGIKHLFINYPITLRPQQLSEEIGVFVNDQLLKVITNEHTTFFDVVESVTHDRRQSRTHQYLSLTETHVGDMMRNDDSTIAFNYPLGLEHVRLQLGNEKVPLYCRPLTYMPSSLQMDVEEEMSYGFVYTNSTYPEFFSQMLSDTFLHILRQVVEDPYVAISRLELCVKQPIGKHHRLLSPSKSLMELFIEQVQLHRDKTAVIYDQQRISFGQLDELSGYVASAILNSPCLNRPCHFLGVYTDRSVYTIAMLMGVIKAGYAVIPLDPNYSAERLHFIVEDSGMPLVVTDFDRLPIQTEILKIDWNKAWETIKENETLPFLSLTNPRRCSEYAYMIYTSGTTGLPKGTPISQSSLLNLIEVRREQTPFSENHVELCFGSISFDASVWSIYPALLSGATVCLTTEKERHDPEALLNVMDREHITSTLLPPTMLSYLPYKELPNLKYLVTGGDVCPEKIIRRWMKTTTIINAYGPTENTVVTTMHVLEQEKVCSTNIGKPLKNVCCYVLDDHLCPVPVGVKGTLYIGGGQLTTGYWNRDELNRISFQKNPNDDTTLIYNSGDIVCQLPNGDFLFFGRNDSQVKIRGFRVELSEIENELLQNPFVQQCAVSVVQRDGKKFIAAYIGTSEPSLRPDMLRVFLAAKLSPYMIPEFWYVAPQLPVNTSSKIDRSALSLLPLNRGEIVSENHLLTEDEIKCLSLLSKVMDTPNLQVDIDADLIDEVGLNSLSVLELSFLLSQRGFEVHASDIYHQRTLRQLAAFVSSSDSLQLTSNQIDSRLCYFATPNSLDKPLLLIICGYRYYEVNYSDLHNALKDDYTIIVLESVIEQKTFRPETVRNASELIEEYVRLLRPIIQQRPLDAITGLCIGGDLALQLAVRLKELSLGEPFVFNIDGMANRAEYKGQMGVMKGLGISEETDRQRRDFTIELARTIPQRHYQGPCLLFLATRFEDIDDFKKEEAEAFYPLNLHNWQMAQPEMEIVFVNDVHMSLTHKPESLKLIKQTIDRLLIVSDK